MGVEMSRPALPDREAVARIIAPGALDEAAVIKYGGWARMNSALTKADDIIALFALSPAQAERDDNREEAAKLTEFSIRLSRLREGEGSSVTLLCDNPDFNGQPNNAIEVCGEWTNWEDRRFTGDTLHAAVLNAYRDMLSAAPKEWE